MRKSRFSSGDALEEFDNGAALFAAIKRNGGIRIELRIRGGRRLMHSSALTSLNEGNGNGFRKQVFSRWTHACCISL